MFSTGSVNGTRDKQQS